MSSRDNILNRIKKNQPEKVPLIFPDFEPIRYEDPVIRFVASLNGIGGTAKFVISYDQIGAEILSRSADKKQIANTIPDIHDLSLAVFSDPHQLEHIDWAVMEGHFGVAENGAVWIDNSVMGDRALPFICQHLAIALSRKEIVHTMHEAYERIGQAYYEFGTFIAGPSKTADIEQSLVLGAHGARSLIVFLLP